MHNVTTTPIDRARYPLGPFNWAGEMTDGSRAEALRDIEQLPACIRSALRDLDSGLIDAPYREGGWTVRQLVHHVADSHMNGYIRLKFALTENTPTLKGYEQARWAELPDSQLDIDISLRILDGVHARWAALWRSMTPADFARTFQHSEYGVMTVERLLHLYGWHSRHHVAHIKGSGLRT